MVPGFAPRTLSSCWTRLEGTSELSSGNGGWLAKRVRPIWVHEQGSPRATSASSRRDALARAAKVGLRSRGSALRVAPRARNALLRAAGFADAFPESNLDSEAIEPALRALKFILARHEPCPAMVIDGAWNVLLTNRAARRLLAAFLPRPIPEPVNVLRLLFDSNGLRPHIDNWNELTTTLLQRLRCEAAGAPANAPIRTLVNELLETPGLESMPSATLPSSRAPLPLVPLVLRLGESDTEPVLRHHFVVRYARRFFAPPPRSPDRNVTPVRRANGEGAPRVSEQPAALTVASR